MREIWKDVVGYEELYLVSNLGRIWLIEEKITVKIGRYKTYVGLVKPHKADGFGHLAVTLRNLKGKSKRYYVHHLVLEAFVGPRPENMEARHFPDRNPANNMLGNLLWGTRQENMLDKKIHGTFNTPPTGKGSSNSFYGKKHTPEALAKMRGRKLSEKHRANLREAWKHRKLREAFSQGE